MHSCQAPTETSLCSPRLISPASPASRLDFPTRDLPRLPNYTTPARASTNNSARTMPASRAPRPASTRPHSAATCRPPTPAKPHHVSRAMCDDAMPVQVLPRQSCHAGFNLSTSDQIARRLPCRCPSGIVSYRFAIPAVPNPAQPKSTGHSLPDQSSPDRLSPRHACRALFCPTYDAARRPACRTYQRQMLTNHLRLATPAAASMCRPDVRSVNRRTMPADPLPILRTPPCLSVPANPDFAHLTETSRTSPATCGRALLYRSSSGLSCRSSRRVSVRDRIPACNATPAVRSGPIRT